MECSNKPFGPSGGDVLVWHAWLVPAWHADLTTEDAENAVTHSCLRDVAPLSWEDGNAPPVRSHQGRAYYTPRAI